MIIFVWRKTPKEDRQVAPIVRGYVNGQPFYSILRRHDGSCITLGRQSPNRLAFRDTVHPTKTEAKARAVDDSRLRWGPRV